MRLIEFREALREAMSEEMRRDEKIFLIADNRKNVLNSWLPCYGCDKLSYNFWFRAILSGFSNI